MMVTMTEHPLVTHAEFMEIFWFCDTMTPEEIKAMRGMSDEDFDEKSPIARRLMILSKIHEALFSIPTKECRVVDEPLPRMDGKKSKRLKKK